MIEHKPYFGCCQTDIEIFHQGAEGLADLPRLELTEHSILQSSTDVERRRRVVQRTNERRGNVENDGTVVRIVRVRRRLQRAHLLLLDTEGAGDSAVLARLEARDVVRYAALALLCA